jgi:hypothetical protein
MRVPRAGNYDSIGDALIIIIIGKRYTKIYSLFDLSSCNLFYCPELLWFSSIFFCKNTDKTFQVSYI